MIEFEHLPAIACLAGIVVVLLVIGTRILYEVFRHD